MVLDIELFVSAWYQTTPRVLLRARRVLLLLLLAAERGGVRCEAQLSKFHVKQNKDFVQIRTRKTLAAFKRYPHKRAFCLFTETPYMDLRAGSTRWYV